MTTTLMKKLSITIEDFYGTNSYIKGPTVCNMQKIKSLDPKIQKTIEHLLSPMYHRIDDFLLYLSNLDFVNEAKIDHQQNHTTAQDRYITIIDKSVAELSKASKSSSATPFQAFSEKFQRQLDSLLSDIANLSKSNLQKVHDYSGDISSLQKTIQLVLRKLRILRHNPTLLIYVSFNKYLLCLILS